MVRVTPRGAGAQGPKLKRFEKASAEVTGKLPPGFAELKFKILFENRGAMTTSGTNVIVPETSLDITLPAMRGLLAHEAAHEYVRQHPKAIQEDESEEEAADRLAEDFSSKEDVDAFLEEGTGLKWPIHGDRLRNRDSG